MLGNCPRCKSSNVHHQCGWEDFTKDLFMQVRCAACNLLGPKYTYGKQGRGFTDSDFGRAEKLSTSHWNAEAHREPEEG